HHADPVAPREVVGKAFGLLRRRQAQARYAAGTGSVGTGTRMRVLVEDESFELQLVDVRHVDDMRQAALDQQQHLLGPERKWNVRLRVRLDAGQIELADLQPLVTADQLAGLDRLLRNAVVVAAIDAE